MADPRRIVPSEALPVTLAELKAQAKLNADITNEDALLAAYLRAAVEEVERFARLALITQIWEQKFPVFEDDLTLRVKPVESIESVEYLDGDDVLQELDPSIYRVVGLGADKTYPLIYLAAGQSWPITADDLEAISVTFTAGYGDTHNDVPELIRHAVLLTAATWINHREDVTSESLSEMPTASKSLLRDWRPLAVA